MNEPMTFQCTWLFELLFANIAAEWFVIVMDVLVLLQVAHEGKLFTTDIAIKGFNPAVRDQVCLQSGLGAKSLFANVAFERPFACVNSVVRF